MDNDTGDKIIAWLRVIATIILLIPICIAVFSSRRLKGSDDAYILTNPSAVTVQWQYQQLKMSQCAWCGRDVNMNRHHVIPQAANPALRDVRENLVVLCRDCHFVLGHRCNWKQYNPDVLYICTHFTNCVKSADTRKSVEAPAAILIPGPVDATPIHHVTNEVPERQRTALERILTWTEAGTNSSHQSRPPEQN